MLELIELGMYRCPFKECDYIANSLGKIIAHVKKKHRNNTVCPACGKKFKLLRNHTRNHLRDEYHLVVHYLIVNLKSRKELRAKIPNLTTKVKIFLKKLYLNSKIF